MTAIDTIDTAPLARARDGSGVPNGSPDESGRAENSARPTAAPTVRSATPADEDAVLVFLDQHLEGGVDRDRARDAIAAALAGTSGIVGIIGNINDIQAAAMLRIEPRTIAPGFVLTRLFQVVRPDRRDGAADHALAEFVARCGEGIGLPIYELRPANKAARRRKPADAGATEPAR
jgi:hypothetical protein